VSDQFKIRVKSSGELYIKVHKLNKSIKYKVNKSV